MLKIIIGLGNPGSDYAATRHNAGFWLLDALAQRSCVQFAAKKKFNAEFAALNNHTYLFKPQTFMNLSGESALAAVNFYRAAGGEVLVVHDEVDFPCGIAKLKHGGSDAGHRGLADISRRIGGGYWRLRIGVGRPAIGSVRDYVLQEPSKQERRQIDEAIDSVLSLQESLLTGDYNYVMQKLHTAPAAPAAN